MAMLETKPSTKEKKFSLIPCSNVYIFFLHYKSATVVISVILKTDQSVYRKRAIRSNSIKDVFFNQVFRR